jgi:hypothetical protein
MTDLGIELAIVRPNQPPRRIYGVKRRRLERKVCDCCGRGYPEMPEMFELETEHFFAVPYHTGKFGEVDYEICRQSDGEMVDRIERDLPHGRAYALERIADLEGATPPIEGGEDA